MALMVGLVVFAPFPTPGPVHAYSALGVLDEPLRATSRITQVSALPSPASTDGVAKFVTTEASSVAVQPLAGLVTVNV